MLLCSLGEGGPGGGGGTGSTYGRSPAACPADLSSPKKMQKMVFFLGFLHIFVHRQSSSAGLPQDRPKMGPRWPKMAPRWLKDGPRWPQDGPKMAPNAYHEAPVTTFLLPRAVGMRGAIELNKGKLLVKKLSPKSKRNYHCSF